MEVHYLPHYSCGCCWHGVVVIIVAMLVSFVFFTYRAQDAIVMGINIALDYKLVFISLSVGLFQLPVLSHFVCATVSIPLSACLIFLSVF